MAIPAPRLITNLNVWTAHAKRSILLIVYGRALHHQVASIALIVRFLRENDNQDIVLVEDAESRCPEFE